MSSLLLKFNVIRKAIFICLRKLLPLLPQVLIPYASVVRRQYCVSGITLGEVCDDMAPTFVVVHANSDEERFAALTFETEAAGCATSAHGKNVLDFGDIVADIPWLGAVNVTKCVLLDDGGRPCGTIGVVPAPLLGLVEEKFIVLVVEGDGDCVRLRRHWFYR